MFFSFKLSSNIPYTEVTSVASSRLRPFILSAALKFAKNLDENSGNFTLIFFDILITTSVEFIYASIPSCIFCEVPSKPLLPLTKESFVIVDQFIFLIFLILSLKITSVASITSPSSFFTPFTNSTYCATSVIFFLSIGKVLFIITFFKSLVFTNKLVISTSEVNIHVDKSITSILFAPENILFILLILLVSIVSIPVTSSR